MTLEDAKDYLNYGIKEGFLDEDILLMPDGSKWSDEYLIQLAERLASRADAYADAVRKGES